MSGIGLARLAGTGLVDVDGGVPRCMYCEADGDAVLKESNLGGAE
jgi:hypothetical protein